MCNTTTVLYKMTNLLSLQFKNDNNENEMKEMKNMFAPFAMAYLSEVLGVKSYLCPESIHSLRSLEGGLPCRVLAVVFKALSSDQRVLLDKIMASIEIFEFSLLEVKNNAVLNQLLFSEERLAGYVCCFGGKDLVKEGLLIEQRGLLVPSGQRQSVEEKPTSFLQVSSLGELEGHSAEVMGKKKQLWKQLKKWKELSKI